MRSICKALLGIAFLIGSFGATAAHAGAHLIHQFTADYLQGHQYRFDPNTGEAFLLLNYLDTYSDQGCYYPNPTPRPICSGFQNRTFVKVPVVGLSFDAVASQIVFAENTGARVVCATVTESHGLFGRKKWLINPTKECAISSVRGGSDGRRLSVFFETK